MAGNPLDFLDTKHRMYTRWVDAWRRNERRAFGRYEFDLMRFDGEGDDRYAERQDRCTYVNFMRAHASAVTGQLRQQGAPTPENGRFSFGALGPIHPADIPDDQQSFADLVYYNVDGVGGDGSEYPVFMDAVDERAQHVGHRILMVEAPPRLPIKPSSTPVLEQPITATDILNGVRPYTLEFPQGALTMWAYDRGRRDFAILRVPMDTGRVEDGKWVEGVDVDAAGNGLGYYLLVRAGCTRLGANYQRGGYWLFSPEKKLIRTGLWGGALRGEIPLWYHYGWKDPGTELEPSESVSTTEGLGRVGVSLMDTMSARDWDAFEAAGSRKWALNATTDVADAVLPQWAGKSKVICVPPAFDEKTNSTIGVTLYDDSAGAVAPAVFQQIIDAKFTEAAQQSFQTLTSLPGSSGWSKEMGFLEVKAPYLSRRASLRQQSDHNHVRYYQLRFGRAASGFARWLREYNLAPLVDEIDKTLETLRLQALRSPDLEAEMGVQLVKRRLGGLPTPPMPAGQEPNPEEFEQRVRQQFIDSVRQQQEQATQDASLANAFGG